MKRVFFALFVLILAGCRISDNHPPDNIVETLNNLTINHTQMIATSTKINGEDRDLTEIIDLSNPASIMIHIIEGEIDYMLLITSHYIYDTRTMHKTPHQFNAYDYESLHAMLIVHTELIDLSLFTHEAVLEIYNQLDELYYNRSHTQSMLRGKDMRFVQGHNNEYYLCELIYDTMNLKEIHFRKEADFMSTKQQSNYISGTHYYFNQPFIGEFPSLELFEESS